MAEVRQDSEALVKIAEQIREVARKFKSESDAFVKYVDEQIGAEDTHPTWYGPNAGNFITEFNKINGPEGDFTKAYGNIMAMADSLDEQANAWKTFEGGNRE